MFERLSGKIYIYVGKGDRHFHMVKANGTHAARVSIGKSSSIAVPKELLGKKVMIQLVVVEDGR